MSHYAKQATMLTRLLGSLIVMVGLMGLGYWIFASVALETESPELARQGAQVLSAVVFILTGALIYMLGQPLGRRTTRDMEDQ